MKKKEVELKSNKRILMVDNDAGFLKILGLMLSDYDCICATDGEAAVKLYLKFRPALVLLEVVLPKMNGIEATRKILEVDPDAKIIGLTSLRDRSKDILEAGAIDVVEKPFRRRELLEVVERYLSDKPRFKS